MKRAIILGLLLAVLPMKAFGSGMAAGQECRAMSYVAIDSITRTETGTWHDMGVHALAYTKATLVVTGLTGAGATLWIDYSNGVTIFTESGDATAPGPYDNGAQYGLAIVGNFVVEMPFVARFVKIRVEDWTAGNVLAIVRKQR